MARTDLFDAAVAGSGPDDPYFFATLKAYFPSELDRSRPRCGAIGSGGKSSRTVVGNDIVNLCGPTFPRRLDARCRLRHHGP